MKISFLSSINQYWLWAAGVVILLGTIFLIGWGVSKPGIFSAQAELDKAQKYYAENDLFAAEQQYKSILNNYPDNYLALNGLGNVLRDKGNLLEAEKTYLQVIDINPRYEFVYRNLFTVYRMWVPAEEKPTKLTSFSNQLKRGLSANSNSTNILATAIDYYRLMGDLDQASRMEEKLVRISK